VSDKQKGKKHATPAAPPPRPASNPNRFYGIIAGLAVVGAIVIYFLMRAPKDVSIPVPATLSAQDTAGFRGYVIGSPDAKVEIVEYADFQCPACGSFDGLQFDVVKRQLIDSGLARFRYRDFPLDQLHPHARLAAHAAACADEQGKFWVMKRVIYDNQATWSATRSAGGLFRGYAQQSGLDAGKYDACMDSKKYAGRIEASLKEGLTLGVGSTPSFVIGGRMYRGALSSDSISAIVRRAAAADSTK
jgi:protein-disulfide isomerase